MAGSGHPGHCDNVDHAAGMGSDLIDLYAEPLNTAFGVTMHVSVE